MRALLIAILALAIGVVAGAAWMVVTEPRVESSEGWELAAPMPQPRGESSAAVVEDEGGVRVLVVGGFTGLGRVSDRVDSFDPATDTWSAAPALPEARHHPAAAGLDGDVYVSGGAATAQATTGEADLWVLRSGAAGWEPLEPMPEPRFAHRMVAVEGRLYVVGGHGRSADVLIYEPGDGWRTGAPLPQTRDHLAAVASEGHVWVLGGRHDGALSTRVDIYDVAGDRWREGPALPTPISAAAVGVLGDTISVVGGEDPDPLTGWVSARHRQLDLQTGQWTSGPSQPLRVHGAADAVVDGRLLVLGGASRQGLWSVLSWSDLTQTYGG